jgi:NMD protein affecting ribosome stability and mRNA decay
MKEHPKDYFEGILQVRDENKELLQWIHNKIVQDGRAAVAKEKKVKNGVDLYISDQHYLQNLGRKIKEHRPGILKTSKRLHTVDKMTSKHLYRVTVLYKPLPFKRGDVITYHGEQIEILRIDNRVQVKYLKSGAKKDLDAELLSRAVR